MNAMIQEIKDILQNHASYQVTHIHREANEVAHSVAYYALRNNDSQNWFVIATEFIRDAI